MIFGLVVRRLKPGTYEEFRKAWEPVEGEQWPRGMTRIWIGRAEDDENVVATWGMFEVAETELDALRDDPGWIMSEGRRMERMGPFEDELLLSTFFDVTEEIVPPGAPRSD